MNEKLKMFYFNSTMVRLKEPNPDDLDLGDVKFQFHYGSIKRRNYLQRLQIVV